MTRTQLVSAAAAVFVVGGGAILYYGRPVMKLPKNDTPSIERGEWGEEDETAEGQGITGAVSIAVSPTPRAKKPAATSPSTPGGYTLATVAVHNTQADCWSVVNGSVYDLTSWVSRHPGGARAIVGMCGKDASASFTRQHGSAGRPQAALALLKIGSLE